MFEIIRHIDRKEIVYKNIDLVKDCEAVQKVRADLGVDDEIELLDRLKDERVHKFKTLARAMQVLHRHVINKYKEN